MWDVMLDLHASQLKPVQGRTRAGIDHVIWHMPFDLDGWNDEEDASLIACSSCGTCRLLVSLAWCAFNIWPSLLMMHYAAFGYAGLRFFLPPGEARHDARWHWCAQYLQSSVPAAASAPLYCCTVLDARS